ncbi:MAG: diacylglycerol kinase [Alicyclobacillus mali]|uniref:diacylglycerol kinase n=1 Tax=Alicyclobacillus mali (ex Roth et al. 2021) TaxID=1123961 RepID=UPI0023F58F41|nr:diacylglycerol kinase [Alicyclobacillus mali (ex Roth et al. 2021)]MCL6487847.1 diacylglycerol kinase [Alicyclobacillus mali (ex Roth et al. 2021)]
MKDAGRGGHARTDARAQPFVRAVAYSLRGVVYAFHTEKNLKRDVWLFTCLAAVEWCLRPSMAQAALTVFVSMCVFAAELFNTAIELAVDVASAWKDHPVAGMAKDVASGAVTFVAFGALAIAAWLLVSDWPWHLWLWSLRNLGSVVLVTIWLMAVWAVRLWPYHPDIEIKRPRKGGAAE